MLAELAAAERQTKPLAVLGPFALDSGHDDLRTLLLQELTAQGYLNSSYTGTHLPNLRSMWEWFCDNCASIQAYFSCVDRYSVDIFHSSVIYGGLFSDVRHFEGIWETSRSASHLRDFR